MLPNKIRFLQDAALLDKIDQKIITALHQNARMAYKDLAVQVGLSAPAVSERVTRLQERGVIQGFHAHIDVLACGYQLEAILLVRTSHQQLMATIATVKTMPEVVSCDTVTGENCLVIRVFAHDIKHLDRLSYQLMPYGDTNTMVVKQNILSHQLPTLA